MPNPAVIRQQINRIVTYLVEVGLASDQNVAIMPAGRGSITEVTFPHSREVSITLKKRNYSEIYQHLALERAYTVRMIDGALILLRYEYESNLLKRHILGFYPSPDLEDFQSDPDSYLQDAMFADITAPNIVRFPIRFDFDCSEGTCVPIKHPRTHLTLGQYSLCRIPVTAPLTPYCFFSFVLRNFYNTAFEEYESKMPSFSEVFENSIYLQEESLVHIRIPSAI